MAKIEPIVGRYVWVPFEGTEYRIYFEETGPANGIPLVCLHTAGTDGREWRHQLCDPAINKNFRVVALDLPRHGKSIPAYEWYQENDEYKLTAHFYSGIIMAFCRELGLEKPVIMGSSMGGNICLHLAEKHENELKALIAIEACEYPSETARPCSRHTVSSVPENPLQKCGTTAYENVPNVDRSFKRQECRFFRRRRDQRMRARIGATIRSSISANSCRR